MNSHQKANSTTQELPPGSGRAKGPGTGLGVKAKQRSNFDRFIDKTIDVVTSMRLSVICLLLGFLLVFFGTIAQVEMGLYKAQNDFFRSFFVVWGPKDAWWKIALPGGYLVGGVLIINLVASHFKRFSLTRDKAGLWMVHIGLILLLLGQLGTDIFSRESSLHLRHGETKNYSEADRQTELAIIDTTDPDVDKVVAISQRALARSKVIKHPELRFELRVSSYFGNSLVQERTKDSTSPPPATKGIGTRAELRELPHATEMDRRDIPSAVIEIVTPEGSQGTWLVSEYINSPQALSVGNRNYQIALRPKRYYKPHSLQLLEFRHDVYPGTQIPKNFSSRVLLQHPEKGEKREVLIYMNNPLRYNGETYYQASFDTDNQGTILQVVRNPSWLTPYFSTILVGLGLTVHFVMHLLGFATRRKKV